MALTAAVQIFVFVLFALIAVLGALGMATTMSMFRSGIFLMGSFMGVGGLFVLLMADLLGMLQIMMYIGGMLVMILFMVLFSHDPGGAMMARMKMSPIEMLFSRGLAHENGHSGSGQESGAHDHEQHGNGSGGHHHGQSQSQQQINGGMDMGEMSMFTPIKKEAAIMATVTCGLLLFFILGRTAWPTVNILPNQNSPSQIGNLLMGKYMIAFEGAGLLILLGIFASVLISRPSEHPHTTDRDRLHAAVAENPSPAEPESLEPVLPIEAAKEQE